MRKLARYLSGRNRGLLQFKKFGFTTVEGDAWSLRPELKLMSGAMLRPAIEETIAEFEKREGVSVTRVYNGCGILVASMRAGERPDAYFACDKSFMDQVNDLFLDATDVSQNQLVILVHKGNPKGIHARERSAQKDLKLGVGHEKQCALGVLTKETLVQSKQYEPVMKNVVVQSPTGDFLVNQLRTGSLDAVIAYISNATASGDKLEAIRIDIPLRAGDAAVCGGEGAANKQLAGRLLEAIESAESKEKFLENGFYWKRIQRTRCNRGDAETQRRKEWTAMSEIGRNPESVWVRGDAPFFVALGVMGATYIFLIVAMLVADVAYTTPGDMRGGAVE